MKESGFEAAYRYLKPYEAYALERGLGEHPDSVMEVVATQCVYEDNVLLERARQALQPYDYVVLLLPTTDLDQSVRILEERQRVLFDGMEMNEHFVPHRSNHDLARLTVYTEGKTPEQTADEVLGLVQAR